MSPTWSCGAPRACGGSDAAGRGSARVAGALGLAFILALTGCRARGPRTESRATREAGVAAATSLPTVREPPIPERLPWPAMESGQVALLRPQQPPQVVARAQADVAQDLVVDLSDAWAPFLFADRANPDEPAKPNTYRSTFLDLANERTDPEGAPLPPGQHLYLEPFGIPPTLSVLASGRPSSWVLPG